MNKNYDFEKIRKEIETGENYTYLMIKPYSSDTKKNLIARNILLDMVKERIWGEPDPVFYQGEGRMDEVVAEGEVQYTPEDIAKHYEEHIGRPYYGNLEKMLLSNSAYGIILKGNVPADLFPVVEVVRQMSGATIKVDRETGGITRLPDADTLRFDAGFEIYQKLTNPNCDLFVPNASPRKGENGKIKYLREFDGENWGQLYPVQYNAENDSVDVYEYIQVKRDRMPVKIAELGVAKNLTHTSDSKESAKKEANIFVDILERQAQANKSENTNEGMGK